MTGTNLAAIITPIVAMISLAAWLAMVFYADAHPGVRRQAAAEPGPGRPRRPRLSAAVSRARRARPSPMPPDGTALTCAAVPI